MRPGMQGCRRQPPSAGSGARLARAGQTPVLYLRHVSAAGTDRRDADALRVRPLRRRVRLQCLRGAETQRQTVPALFARDRPERAGGAVHRRRLARRRAGGRAGGHPRLASAGRACGNCFPAGRKRVGRRAGGVCAKPHKRRRRRRRKHRVYSTGPAADGVLPVAARPAAHRPAGPFVLSGAGYVPDAPNLRAAVPGGADAVSAGVPPQPVPAFAAKAGVYPTGGSFAPPASDRRADRRPNMRNRSSI